MKTSKTIIIAAGLCAAATAYAAPTSAEHGMQLYFDKPATEPLTQGLPIGGGRFGAIVMGGIGMESMPFNDLTLWSGSSAQRGAYQAFGSINIRMDSAPATNYKRMLNIDSAIASVEYDMAGIHYRRQYIASHSAGVIAMRFSANRRAAISMTISLNGTHHETTIAQGKYLSFAGKFQLISYQATLHVQHTAGSMAVSDSGITITNANEVVVYLACATNYSATSPNYIAPNNWKDNIIKNIQAAASKGFSKVLSEHVADYKSLYDRMRLDLHASMPSAPTNELLMQYAAQAQGANHSKHAALYVEMLYFNYARYLMIACSRNGTDLPSNLQGLWNVSNAPPWEADIHSNINVQMNYWMAEGCNLAECHLPFLNYIYNESQVHGWWSGMAAEHGCRGWTLKTQNNIFGYSDWEWNRPANAWYCLHLWEHYLYFPDSVYLRQRAYPAMRSACEFWLDRLIMGDDGKLLAPNEWSPEHGPWEDGMPYAQQLVWNLFGNTIAAAGMVGDVDFLSLLKEKHSRLDAGLAIGSWGQLREWRLRQDKPEDRHRHVSHLVGLYPCAAISPYRDSAMAAAARVSLTARGDAGTGWSRAWKIALWARLHDGEHAHRLLQGALALTDGGQESGGVYENMLDAHPPFQIDGNFGAAAGIVEMLMQSHMGELHLLPALPAAWGSGVVEGLRGRGGFLVDMEWRGGLFVSADIVSTCGGMCAIRLAVPFAIKELGIASAADGMGSYRAEFPTNTGRKYKIEAIH